ncbi:hypothetical protein ACLOJK_013322 [Asimina triloba]
MGPRGLLKLAGSSGGLLIVGSPRVAYSTPIATPIVALAVVPKWGLSGLQASVPSGSFRYQGGYRCFAGRLNEQSILLDPSLLSFYNRNMADSDFIELINGVERAKVKLPYELLPLVNAHELGGSDRSLPLVTELCFEQDSWEDSTFERFKNGTKAIVDVVADHMSCRV